MPRPDDLLSSITRSLEGFTQRIGQIADVFLDYISTIFRNVIEFLKTVAERIYRFTKEMLVNILKLLWAFLKILLFFLAPTFVLFFGLEILSSEFTGYYTVIGWILLCSGTIGILLFTLALVASFVKRKEDESGSNRKVATSGALLITIDIIAVGLITASVIWLPRRHFEWWLLRETETAIRLVNYSLSGDLSDKPAIAKIVRVADNANETVEFNLKRKQRIRILGIGALDQKTRYDYGWIENAETRQVVWEMTELETVYAGGSQWNRKVDKIVFFLPGRYKLRYISDGSFSYDTWNSGSPPELKFWGIALYEEN